MFYYTYVYIITGLEIGEEDQSLSLIFPLLSTCLMLAPILQQYLSHALPHSYTLF